jgi:xylulokinase
VHVLAIDVGTSGTKACVYDGDGRALGRSHVSCGIRRPAPGLAEQDPEIWWQAAVAATRSALASVTAPHEIEALAVSSMNALVLLDDAGKPTRPAIMQLDRRAVGEASSLEAELGADIASITGNAVSGPGFWLPMLRWLQRHERESIDHTSVLMYPNGYVAQRLSGVASVDRTRAATTLLFDDASDTWSDHLRDLVGLSVNQLPEVFDPTDVLGPLRKDAAGLLGLPDGIPVVAGAMDSVAGALGLGLLESGDCAVMFGTVARVGLLNVPEPLSASPSPLPGIVSCPYPQSGLRWSMSALWHAGTSLRWIAEALYGGEWDAIRLPERPSALGDLVFVAPSAETEGRVSGINLTHNVADVGAAGVIGVLAALADRLNELEHARACPTKRVAVCGRGAQLLAPAVAGLLGLPIEVPNDPETDTRGGAILASTGAGLFPDVRTAALALRGCHKRFRPVANWTAYRARFRGVSGGSDCVRAESMISTSVRRADGTSSADLVK